MTDFKERYEVTSQCCECDGWGEIERRTSVDSYRATECEWCQGYGEIIDRVEYDSVAEVRDDYPRATSIRRIASANGAALEMLPKTAPQ
jgi:hypothetical protein